MRGFLQGLLDDDRGQDLVEYALLTAAIGLAATVVFDQIRDAIRNASQSWDQGVNNLWVPSDPGVGS